jgi:hypothetical protein
VSISFNDSITINKLEKSINNYNELEKVVLNRKVKILMNQESDKKTIKGLNHIII